MSLRSTKRAKGVRGEEAGTSKRRRADPDDPLWQIRPVSDLKMSSIYNRSAPEAPAELFRKDLISAMKLPDSEPLTSSEYWVITDTWKQDWERGVQVPVNPDSLPAPKVKIIDNPKPPNFQEFKLPKDKYIHLSSDTHYRADQHFLSPAPARAEAACSYDLDATDAAWLRLLNAERARAGAGPVTEDQLEKVIEELEVRTWDKIQAIMKSEEGLGIEYDENVICDVCRSPDSEDGNEMVFCDSCNICVHQACYGITVIPDGQWLCRPCGDGVRPTCALCPNLGGAMKCTPNVNKWAHVSCVLWIPEVSIECAEKMEPITKISSIPASRWSLVCVLCRQRKGACIQCSVKTCKTAYHVTCAFKHGLEMRAIIEDEHADDGVKLRSYCQKHSVNSKKDKCSGSGSEEEEVKRKRRKDMTSEEKTQARAARLQEIEREFDRHVSVKDISTHLLDVDQDAINYIYNYWKLKRRSGHNRPLLPQKSDDTELLTHKQEQADLDKMKMFVQLRQDLERVRNLCYMVSRREKLSRSFFRMREQTFHKQVAVLSADETISGPDIAAIVEANHGPSIYDRLYSHPDAPDHKNDFEALLARIAPSDSGDEKKKDRNGLMKGSKSANPYKKHYVNGSRRSGVYSGLSSEESAPEISRTGRFRRTVGSSTDEDVKKPGSPKKKVSPKMKGLGKRSPKKTERKKKKMPQSKAVVESSSEEEIVPSRPKKDQTRSKTLQQMEKEMTAGMTGHSGTDSDELVIKSTRKSKFPVDIYSDSSEEPMTTDLKFEKNKPEKIKPEKSKTENSPTETDSQQPLPRTKAAMKEFIPTQPEKKSPDKSPDKITPKKRGRKPSNKDKAPPPVVVKKESDDEAKNKENIKLVKQKDATDLIVVPQRQAAKKASENMRSTTTVVKKDETVLDKPASEDDKPKPKVKSKPSKEESSSKPTRKKSRELGKEPIAYVPQRQAAKKAAAHIKSGLGNKPLAIENVELKKDDKTDILKMSPKKDIPKSKSPQKESSSSSSSSSSSYSSSSSSEDEPEKPSMKPTAKAKEIKPSTVRQPSIFSPPGSRPTVDLPFLDKVSRPLSSTSASSDSESSHASRESGSSSPAPKRPRRRRKNKSISTDIKDPPKDSEKKLKTSELQSECGEPSSITPREESRSDDTRTSTRARTRSTASSGNLSHKPDARLRKSSGDEIFTSPTKSSKESSQPGQLSTQERKEDSEIIVKPKIENVSLDPNESRSVTPKRKRSISSDENDKQKTPEVLIPAPIKISPRKSTDTKHKTTPKRRQSVKDPPPQKELSPPLESPAQLAKERRLSRHDPHTTIIGRSSLSPIKKQSPVEKISQTPTDVKPVAHDDYKDDTIWTLPKAPSPDLMPPPVEKPGTHEKYMSEDKSSEYDTSDKSSVKMIAKIRANLNENTMIKSPKTPLNLDPIEVENSMMKNIRKRTVLDTEKKYINQDSSHVQGVEISKSAKIPSALNTYPNRSMFSPQPKDSEFFDMLAVDEGFHHDDVMKPFTSYPDINFFKEDSKEQGVQETLNLVDRLRMQLSTKKAPADNSAQDESTATNEGKEHEDVNNMEESTNPPSPTVSVDEKPTLSKEMNSDTNNISHHIAPDSHRTSVQNTESAPIITNEKWAEMSQIVDQSEGSYNHPVYKQRLKSSPPAQSDITSVNEADNISISKQSDDSQSLSVADHSAHSNDQLTQDNQNYDNNNSVIHSDCATISSPYVSGQESKWRQSKIATRRSSASSTNSEGSVCSQKTDIKVHLNNCEPRTPNRSEIEQQYSGMTYSGESQLPLNQYPYGPEAPPFLTSMRLPLFTNSGARLPTPSLYPGLGLTPPLPQLSKPAFPALGAAFTSSSQNIAITTAMIAPPTPKPADSPRDDCDAQAANRSGSSPVADSLSEPAVPPTKPKPEPLPVEPVLPPSEPESPPKPRPKLSSKSPGKSPGISPKRSDAKAAKRAASRNQRGGRGRGRPKSRALPADPGSIQSKLVGTVYDFEDEIANDGVEVKALRRSSPRGELAPLLPGPVDMRTYQPGAPEPPPHLLAFASGTAEQPLADIDEELEKQLHSDLMSSKPPTPVAASTTATVAPPAFSLPPAPKVSLSDSRNQLKVKIKGPFLDANYSASSSVAVVPAVAVPILPNPSAMAGSSGSGNLRRMRKKELLRQYWTEDTSAAQPAPPAPAAAAPPPARAVITIPKAVASMTCIPTSEDYRLEPIIEKKKRKTSSGLSRELRHLEVTMRDELDPSAPPPPPPVPHHRKRKTPRQPPKLKIKLGADPSAQECPPPPPPPTVPSIPTFHFRPPKKRIVIQPTPSLKDLRRESMKYRKQVMADFEENEKTEKHKPGKSEKRKKKKDKKLEKLLVVNNSDSASAKLIIKIKRSKEEEAEEERRRVSSAAASSAPKAAPVAASGSEQTVDPFDYDPSATDPLALDPPSYAEASSAFRKIRTAKVTPIRLKLARSSQGEGYVMKDTEAPVASSSTTVTSNPAAERDQPHADSPLPLTVNKHCEVR